MPVNRIEVGKAVCPFLSDAKGTEISCAGEKSPFQSMLLRFPNKTEAQAWKEDFCDDHCFSGCPIYQMLESSQYLTEDYPGEDR